MMNELLLERERKRKGGFWVTSAARRAWAGAISVEV